MPNSYASPIAPGHSHRPTSGTPHGLTAQGQAALRACHQAASAIEDRMLARLSPAHRRQLADMLLTCIEDLT